MSKFSIHYYKIKKIVLEDLEKMYCKKTTIQYQSLEKNEEQEDDTHELYNPFQIDKLQCYNPIYNIFFEMNEFNYDSISLNNRYHIFDLQKVIDKETDTIVKRDIFIKFSPLLDPIRYLIGKYNEKKDELILLPSYFKDSNTKINNPNNASYVDNFFCYLTSKLLTHHKYVNAIDFYGSFLGIQKKYKFNVADDIDYLMQSDYFTQNKGKIYDIEEINNPFSNFGSRNNKNKLIIHNSSNITDISLEKLEDIDIVNDISSSIIMSSDCVYEKNDEEISVNSSDNSDLNYSGDEEDEHNDNKHHDNKNNDKEEDEDEEENEDEDEHKEEDEEENEDEEEEEDDDEEEDEDEDEEEDENEDEDEDEEEEEEQQINAYINDFPIQMICLEKCKGTLDELFVRKQLDLDSAASALFQVIVTLILYQKIFHFTHNDLHTNNIMYIETDEEYVTYKYENKYYKVPTFGKVFKIIDYGRAIYKFQGRTFCSDSFAPGGDASTQYNCEPYFNEKKSRLDPNYSFDLCRLGCSIYDFILDIEDENDKNFAPDELQRTIIRWVTDDNGKNVLYMKNGEERYENFKLYKMIARSVHAHTPDAQLEDPFFNQFLIDEKLVDMNAVIDINTIPCYV